MDKTNTPKGKRDFYKTKHFRSMLIIVFLLITAFSANIFVSTFLFNRATREYREEIICKAAKLAAEQIDGYNIDKWLETGADDQYVRTEKLLQSICNNTPYIQYLYVYQIKPDGCRVVFDIETAAAELDQYDELPDVSAASLGEVIEFDESFSEDIPTLLEGGQIGIKESNDKYGWLLTKYEPITDSDGRCAAYVGVDISMIGVNDYNHTFFRWIVVISVLFFLMLFIAAYHYTLRARKADEYDESERRGIQQKTLFEQTAKALAGAIDAKDEYTHGHSARVAKYSRKIAEVYGFSPEECDVVYYAALLHDVGKIGVPDHIINKKGRLTDEEYAEIKQHPVIGEQILSTINEYPYLSIGAHYHHERYDGKGYPEGLKGEEIPEIARIIAVADAYDAMTSNRSYRNAIPQHIVREELVKGIGTQFDPEYAKIMIHLLDLDTEYRMQETETGANLSPETSLRCDTIYNSCTDGVMISEKPTRIRLCSLSDKGVDEDKSLPSLIVFDCLDAKVHPGEEKNKDLLYYEYAQIRFDGHITEGGIRKSQISDCKPDHDLMRADPDEPDTARHYLIEAVRIGDHARIRISGEDKAKEIILALPDSSRFMYMALGGENCYIHNIIITNDTSAAEPEDIPRIAEEISYIKGCPEGDVPNIEVPGWRAATTPGIPIGEGLTLSFHSRSLPVARLVWHCPYISVFSSADGTVDGDDLREYILLRLDGENWESDDHVKNKVKVNTLDSFVGWNAWNDRNKEGIDCVVTIRREKNRIIMQTENLGIAINSVTTINEEVKDVYVALTGDQCAITDIHISRDMQPER